MTKAAEHEYATYNEFVDAFLPSESISTDSRRIPTNSFGNLVASQSLQILVSALTTPVPQRNRSGRSRANS